MPTPVSTARQCLTAEAARALDEAVGVARRRGHAQTTSLHAVSALLAMPSSALREACARARNSAYPPRLQFKALELCFGVALDRLPTSQALDEPPISNSLMAAIKRSQANQRRHPDSFHLYQQQQQSSSLSIVQVELQHLILSILDDPVVSRVFGEAGFRSCDIKLAIVRPPPPLVRYSRTRCPPLFLCNLTGDEMEACQRSFSFPFSGFPGYSGFADGDENSRRIGEVLARKKNPLLVGVCANDALRSFSECVERETGGILPAEISGLKLIPIEKEISGFITVSGSEELLGARFKELGHVADSCSRPGLVVNFGDLKSFVGDGSMDAVNHVVSQLTGLLELHQGKMWLMGAATSYETYLKFLTRFPSIEKDWDLQLLPITSLRPSMGGLHSRSSLMESFVPLGGFFSSPSELKLPLSSTCQPLSRCHGCNEKYEREVSAIQKGECAVSVADQTRGSLPSWLQMTEHTSGFDAVKAKDDGTVLNTKLMGLQKKWNDICHRLHHSQPLPEADIYQVESQVPGILGVQFLGDRETAAGCLKSTSIHASPNESRCGSGSPYMHKDLQKIASPKPNRPTPGSSEVLSKVSIRPSKAEHLRMESACSPPHPPSYSNIPDEHASPSSVTSVTTDLALGALYPSTGNELKKATYQADKKCLQDFSGCFSAEVDVSNDNNTNNPLPSSSCSGPDLGGQFNPRDFKTLWRVLTDKVSWQDEAIDAISQAVARCQMGNERRCGTSLRGDKWFTFLGPDRVGKKRIAVALAEIFFGSRRNLICVDLSSPDRKISSNKIFDLQEINDYDVKFRGKTVVDYIAGELSKKPLSVVFLENVDKADVLVQNSLSQAIKTSKFSDSHGREVGINNAIFVTTSRFTKGFNRHPSGKEPVRFSEERILESRGWQMQISIECMAANTMKRHNTDVLVTMRNGTSNPLFMNKRKFIGTTNSQEQCESLEMVKRVQLDLNIPVEEMEVNNSDNDSYDSDNISENSEAWLEDFFDRVDEVVVFKPFNFDALADKILKIITDNFLKMVGSECLLEIDSEVMEQILAAVWLSERKLAVEDWVVQVLGPSFAEARRRYNLTTQSVLKLVTCDGLYMEEQAPGVCLPARIILN